MLGNPIELYADGMERRGELLPGSAQRIKDAFRLASASRRKKPDPFAVGRPEVGGMSRMIERITGMSPEDADGDGLYSLLCESKSPYLNPEHVPRPSEALLRRVIARYPVEPASVDVLYRQLAVEFVGKSEAAMIRQVGEFLGQHENRLHILPSIRPPKLGTHGEFILSALQRIRSQLRPGLSLEDLAERIEQADFLVRHGRKKTADQVEAIYGLVEADRSLLRDQLSKLERPDWQDEIWRDPEPTDSDRQMFRDLRARLGVPGRPGAPELTAEPSREELSVEDRLRRIGVGAF